MLRPKFPTQPNPRLGPINLDCHELKVGFALLVKSVAILISFGVLLTSCLTIPGFEDPAAGAQFGTSHVGAMDCVYVSRIWCSSVFSRVGTPVELRAVEQSPPGFAESQL